MKTVGFLLGMVIGLFLALYLLAKGDMTNLIIGRDKVEIIHYIKVNDRWIKRDINP